MVDFINTVHSVQAPKNNGETGISKETIEFMWSHDLIRFIDSESSFSMLSEWRIRAASVLVCRERAAGVWDRCRCCSSVERDVVHVTVGRERSWRNWCLWWSLEARQARLEELVCRGCCSAPAASPAPARVVTRDMKKHEAPEYVASWTQQIRQTKPLGEGRISSTVGVCEVGGVMLPVMRPKKSRKALAGAALGGRISASARSSADSTPSTRSPSRLTRAYQFI